MKLPCFQSNITRGIVFYSINRNRIKCFYDICAVPLIVVSKKCKYNVPKNTHEKETSHYKISINFTLTQQIFFVLQVAVPT